MRSAPLPGIGTSREGTRTRWGPVAEALRQALASGSLEPGELLPSTRELAASYGVHRQTVMVALDALCAEGWLRAEARRGYRVLPPDPALPSTRPQRRASFQFRARPAGGPALPALDDCRVGQA